MLFLLALFIPACGWELNNDLTEDKPLPLPDNQHEDEEQTAPQTDTNEGSANSEFPVNICESGVTLADPQSCSSGYCVNFSASSPVSTAINEALDEYA
ncbi:MAG: hypothetical protein HQM16_19190, partial [Deltaproteobacteria bacterium]|nr:hypothetical protein [Deltaproteobacteria bacterium]